MPYHPAIPLPDTFVVPVPCPLSDTAYKKSIVKLCDDGARSKFKRSYHNQQEDFDGKETHCTKSRVDFHFLVMQSLGVQARQRNYNKISRRSVQPKKALTKQ